MSAKTLFVSAIFGLLPLAAIAQASRACEDVHANCQAGTDYDAEKKT